MKKDIHNKLIKYGCHSIANWVVLEIEGNKQKVDEFLQGQLTSDIHKIDENGFQLSSICDHKGFVICDFIINLKPETVPKSIKIQSSNDAKIEGGQKRKTQKVTVWIPLGTIQMAPFSSKIYSKRHSTNN